MSFGDVVEGHDIVAKFADKVKSKRDDGQEGKLIVYGQTIEVSNMGLGRT